MTPAEWQDVAEWVDDRWPDGWTAQQQIAFYHDIQPYDASDVWAAVMAIYNSGREFPPSGSLLKSRTIDEARRSARDENWRQLPAPTAEAVFWKEYAVQTYGEELTMAEAVRLEHKKWDGCRAGRCDIHKR